MSSLCSGSHFLGLGGFDRLDSNEKQKPNVILAILKRYYSWSALESSWDVSVEQSAASLYCY